MRLETRLSQPPDERVGAPDVADSAAGPVVPLEPIAVDPVTVEPVPGAAPRGLSLNWTIVVAIIVADQVTKALVRGAIAPFDTVTVIPNFVNLTYVENPGVAFGLLSTLATPWKAVVTTSLALVALVGISYYARHIRPEEKLARLGLAIILGGAIGNLIDRLWYRFVLDFVDVYVGTWHFWAFNIADASITIGAVLVLLDLLTNRHASTSV